jgi:beta-propeller uncharacterized protein DUF5122
MDSANRVGKSLSRFCFLTLLFAGPALSQQVDTTLWVPNGRVNSLVAQGSTLYLGGDFTTIGPATGAFVPIDPVTGHPSLSYPKVTGIVFAAIPDDAGGWFLGGRFYSVGGVPRSGLAHVLQDGSVSPWSPEIGQGSVQALAKRGNTIFIAGGFDTLNGEYRERLGAVDATTGILQSWDPHPDGSTTALAATESTLFVGGYFDSISGDQRLGLAVFDTSGTLLPWNTVIGHVRCFSLAESTLYVGGDLHFNGNDHHLAAVNLPANLALPWPSDPNGTVYALFASGDTLLAGGAFDMVNSEVRHKVAAINASDGSLFSWAPDIGAGYVTGIVRLGNAVYMGGYFSQVGGESRPFLGAVDAASGLATSWDPHASDVVRVLTESGGSLFAGGYFTSVGGVDRTNLAAIDLTTGKPNAWNPSTDITVLTMGILGSKVYIGGNFTEVNGVSRNHLAALDAATGALSTWNPDADAWVNTLLLWNGKAYVGGPFSFVGGQERWSAAAVDTLTGAATAWDPHIVGNVYALAKGDSTVYIGGQFNQIRSVSFHNLAEVDTSAGALTHWIPAAVNGEIQSLLVAPNSLYVGGFFVSGSRDGLAEIDRVSGVLSTFGADAHGFVTSLASGVGTVFVGGSIYKIGDSVPGNLVEMDKASGNVLWDPEVFGDNRLQYADGYVRALCITGTTLYAGGGFTSVQNQPQTFLAAFPSLPTPIGLSYFKAEFTTDAGVLLSWAASGDLAGFHVYRSGSADRDYDRITSTLIAPDASVSFRDADAPQGTTLYYRLEAIDRAGHSRFFGPLTVHTDMGSGIKPSLGRSFPNPFAAGDVTIPFAVAKSGMVRLRIFDVNGRQVRLLASERMEPGSRVVTWDGRDDLGHFVPGGVYLYELQSPGFRKTQRLVRLR